jgi:Cu-Zn family superoxide dismutase
MMTGTAWSDGKAIDIRVINNTGVRTSLGTVTVASSPYGAKFTPALMNLTPGLHGFHVHENPDCSPAVKGG